MAITLDTVEQYLKEMEYNYNREAAKYISFRTGKEGNKQSSIIRLTEDGEMFSWKVYLLDNSDAHIALDKKIPHLLAIYEYILELNGTYKFGCWELDSDREIRFTIEFPLEDATLTKKQFKRCMQLINTSSANKMFTLVRKMIETGSAEEDTQETTSSSDKSSSIEALEQKIAALKAAQAQASQQASTPSAPLNEDSGI